MNTCIRPIKTHVDAKDIPNIIHFPDYFLVNGCAIGIEADDKPMLIEIVKYFESVLSEEKFTSSYHQTKSPAVSEAIKYSKNTISCEDI